MNLRVRNTKGRVVRTISVRDDVFGAPMNQALVHQVIVGQLANARQGTVRTKTRAEVSGGGAKPRPQKGSGRSRMGSIRSPVLVGGGRAFGPKPRSYRHKTTKRARRSALVAVLSDKVREDNLVVVDDFSLEQHKTKEMAEALGSLDALDGILLVADGADEKVLRAARNISRVKMLPAALLNSLDVLNAKRVVMTLDAVHKAEELWGGRGGRRQSSVAEVAG